MYPHMTARKTDGSVIVCVTVFPDEIEVGFEFLFGTVVLGFHTTKHRTEVHGLGDDYVSISPALSPSSQSN
jgi:hypothetical protein